MSNRHYVRQAFVETPWAILPNKLMALEEIVERHAAGEKLDAADVQSRIHGATRPPERRLSKVAVLPLFGTIFPRANLMTEMSGATSAERFGAIFASLVNDPEVGAIVLDVDSPGGAVYGVAELSQQIFEARGTKPIIAVANHMMASAAYWIGSAADELVVSPSGDVGSIGVFAVHQDISGALEKEGIKTSIIRDGKYKAELNPFTPLSDEARAALQASVSESYTAFVEAVARNRGVEADAVRNGFGEGRMVSARQAVELGMADRVETLNETLERIIRSLNASSASVAMADVSGGGQEPAEQTPQALAQERERLDAVKSKFSESEGDSMRIRELQKQRAALVARAQELFDQAENESRDFTPEEREEFDRLMGQGDAVGRVGEVDAKIEQILADREKVRAAAEKKFEVSSEAIKPDQETQKIMKRGEFDALSPSAQAAFMRGGGTIKD